MSMTVSVTKNLLKIRNDNNKIQFDVNRNLNP